MPASTLDIGKGHFYFMYIIYRHTSPSGKSYIGLTSRKPEERWKNGAGYRPSHHGKFYKAIKKYGWNNFEHIIIEENILTLKEAKQREIYWISYFNSYQHGYNSTPGGDGGHRWTIKQKERLRKRCLGKKVSEETKKKLSEALKKRWANVTKKDKEKPVEKTVRTSWNKGKHHSDETKEKIKQKNLNREYKDEWSDKLRKPILQCNLDGEVIARFKGMGVAERATGIPERNISNVCRGKRKTAGGYIWKYADP